MRNAVIGVIAAVCADTLFCGYLFPWFSFTRFSCWFVVAVECNIFGGLVTFDEGHA